MKFEKLHEQQPENMQITEFFYMAVQRLMEFCLLQDELANEDELAQEMRALSVCKRRYNLAGSWGVSHFSEL